MSRTHDESRADVASLPALIWTAPQSRLARLAGDVEPLLAEVETLTAERDARRLTAEQHFAGVLDPVDVIAGISRDCLRARAERDALAATVQRVRELHRNTALAWATGDTCDECESPRWPCPTIRALDGLQETTEPNLVIRCPRCAVPAFSEGSMAWPWWHCPTHGAFKVASSAASLDGPQAAAAENIPADIPAIPVVHESYCYVDRGAELCCCDEPVAAVPTEPAARPSTPDRRNDDGSTTITMKRACNGCHRQIGDATEAELDAAMNGWPLADVRGECGCVAAVPTVQPGPTKSAAELLREIAARDPEAHNRALARGYGVGPSGWVDQSQCDHSESRYGRCTGCGMTWEQQSEARAVQPETGDKR